MRPTPRLPIPILALLLLATACGEGEEAARQGPPPAPAVEVAEARREPVSVRAASVVLTDGFPVPEPGAGDQDAEQAAAVAAALAGRSDLRTQRLVAALQEEQLAAERRSGFPSLGLTADYGRRASTDDFPEEDDFVDSLAAGLLFEVDLFDGWERKGRVAQAEAALDRERQRLAQLTEGVRLEVEQALLSVRAGREWVEASRGTVARAERALEIAQLRFRNGLSTQLELDDAERAVTEARTNLARALHTYATARAALLAATGGR